MTSLVASVLSVFQAVAEGKSGERKALNSLAGPAPAKASRSHSKTGKPKGRPKGTGVGSGGGWFYEQAERWQSLCSRKASLNPEEQAELERLTSAFTQSRKQAGAADPDGPNNLPIEKSVRLGGGRFGVRVKAEVLPREVSSAYSLSERGGFRPLPGAIRFWEDVKFKRFLRITPRRKRASKRIDIRLSIFRDRSGAISGVSCYPGAEVTREHAPAMPPLAPDILPAPRIVRENTIPASAPLCGKLVVRVISSACVDSRLRAWFDTEKRKQGIILNAFAEVHSVLPAPRIVHETILPASPLALGSGGFPAHSPATDYVKARKAERVAGRKLARLLARIRSGAGSGDYSPVCLRSVKIETEAGKKREASENTPAPAQETFRSNKRLCLRSAPLRFASRPTLPDQQAHSLKAILARVKAGSMLPEVGAGLFEFWPMRKSLARKSKSKRS